MAAPLNVRVGNVQEGSDTTFYKVGDGHESWGFMDTIILLGANRHAARRGSTVFVHDQNRSPFFDEPLRGR